MARLIRVYLTNLAQRLRAVAASLRLRVCDLPFNKIVYFSRVRNALWRWHRFYKR